MNFASSPKTQREWQLTCLRSCLFAGSILLLVEVWARTFLAGLRRQNVEETLWPFAWIFVVLLLYCSLAAFVSRKRLLGAILAVIGILSSLTALLPILREEGVYD